MTAGNTWTGYTISSHHL